MATAEFDAQYVYDAAVARVAELTKKNDKIKQEREAEYQKRVDKFVTYRGGFLWMKTKSRTPWEAESAYLDSLSIYSPFRFSPVTYSTEYETNIARLAKAAMLDGYGRGFVTLTAEDCRAIGIPADFEVPA